MGLDVGQVGAHRHVGVGQVGAHVVVGDPPLLEEDGAPREAQAVRQVPQLGDHPHLPHAGLARRQVDGLRTGRSRRGHQDAANGD